MNRRVLFAALLLAAVVSVNAQTKSVKKAALLSMILPGAGEIYTENYKKAVFFMSTEVIILMSYGYVNSEVDNSIDTYKMFAGEYAGSDFDQSDDYFQIMHDNFSFDEYNANIERRARNYYLLYKNDTAEYQKYLDNNLLSENNRWEWENEGKWLEYRDLRKDKQNIKIVSNFLVAAVLLNRLVSTIDAVTSAKKFNISQRKTSRIYVKPDFRNKGIRLHYEIKF